MRSGHEGERNHRNDGQAPQLARSATPGRSTLVEQTYGTVQCKASGGPAAAGPGDAFALATSGAASSVPYQDRMERAFGRSFAGVQAHVGGTEAARGLEGLGAQAAAHGNAIAFREATPSPHLVAHELAHVVQQSSGGGVQCKPAAVSTPGSDAEQRADAAADAVIQGLPVPDVGSAPGGEIHRAVVNTYGGQWTTEGTSDLGTRHYRENTNHNGVDIHMSFVPGEIVECPKIGLTQSILNQQATAADPTTLAPYQYGDAEYQQEQRDRGISGAQEGGGQPGGRMIDRAAGNINPLYPTNNPTDATGAVNSRAALGDSPEVAFWGQHGHRNRTGGSFDVKDAILIDTPWLPGQLTSQTFETTAVCVEGRMAGTYLGSVKWGYNKDASGVHVHAFEVASMGVPTSAWMAAAGKWNDATIHVGGTPQDTLNLPTTNHQTVDPASLDDEGLERRMRVLHEQMRSMREADDPTTFRNLQFEIRGLGREAVRRATDVVDSGHTYTTRSGDTLWGIARRFLGGGRHWVKIFALNCVEMQHGDILATGATLKMPRPYNPGGG
jgi:hypothetical protein